MRYVIDPGKKPGPASVEKRPNSTFKEIEIVRTFLLVSLEAGHFHLGTRYL